MNLGHGSTKRDKPRKAFGAYNEKYSNNTDFGDSSITTGKLYRKRWAEGSSLFRTILKLIILLPIGVLMVWVSVTEIIKAFR